MKEVHLSESNFLLSAIQRGDQKAFDALFRRYYPALCAYGHRFVNLEDAEEIVQEIMLWIWEKHSELIIESSLSQYLFKMTYHRALNLIAKKEIINRFSNGILVDKAIEKLEEIFIRQSFEYQIGWYNAGLKHRIRNISRDAGKSTDLLWEVEYGQPASDLSAKEKRFLESDRGQSTGGM